LLTPLQLPCTPIPGLQNRRAYFPGWTFFSTCSHCVCGGPLPDYILEEVVDWGRETLTAVGKRECIRAKHHEELVQGTFPQVVNTSC